MKAFDDMYVKLMEKWPVSPELKPLVYRFYAAMVSKPLRLEDLKGAVHDLLVFLASPEGRTDANCRAVDYFISVADWPHEWPELPDDIGDIVGDMGGALHDTITSPDIAENFESTPEQLLERLRRIL